MRFSAKVLESRPLTPTIHGIRVSRPADFAFEPVQFTHLRLETSEGPESYPMSLASSPTRPYLEWGARISDSPWKQAFRALRPGDEVLVDGPRGHFLLDEKRPAVLVAGGIGITPLKGMAEYATDKRLAIPVTMLYSNRDAAEIAYRKELEELGKANARFTLLHTLTRAEDDETWTGRRGRIDAALMAEVHAKHPEAVYYLCGTPDMVEQLFAATVDLGVPEERVRYEQFWGY